MSFASYEYRVLPMSASALTEQSLNQLGTQGWRLVATMPSIILERCTQPPTRSEPREGMPMLMSVASAATQLQMSKSSMYKLIQERQIPIVRIGRSTRIRRETLEQFVADRLDH